MSRLIKFTKFFTGQNSQNGQILLIVVLATVVTLTVGLSAISRTITNTRVSTEEANSQKALSAAEAGIEEFLNNQALLAAGTLNATTLSNGSIFKAKATKVLGPEYELNDGGTILQDDGADIWLTSYPDFTGSPWNGTLDIYYTHPGDPCNGPAIEVALIQGANRANPEMKRYTADGCSRGNNFSAAAGGGGVLGKSYQNRISVNVTNGYIARVIPLYANTEMAVRTSGDPLPNQGYVIDSTGSSGNTSRKLRVFQAHPRLPIEFFPYNVFLP